MEEKDGWNEYLLKNWVVVKYEIQLMPSSTPRIVVSLVRTEGLGCLGVLPTRRPRPISPTALLTLTRVLVYAGAGAVVYLMGEGSSVRVYTEQRHRSTTERQQEINIYVHTLLNNYYAYYMMSCIKYKLFLQHFLLNMYRYMYSLLKKKDT